MSRRSRNEDPDWDPEDLERPSNIRIKEDEESLYFILRNGNQSLTSVADDWIRDYEKDRKSALLSILQLFISSSGCQGTITPTMLDQMEISDIIVQMTDAFGEDSGRYPLVTPGQVWKRFRHNFGEFIQVMILQCQNQIIYDNDLMDKIMALLAQLSDSQVRAFRHTATLGAVKLMTALVDVTSNIEIKKKNTQRQINAERNRYKETKIRGSDRLDALETQLKELEENADRIKLTFSYLFKAIFVHRYRDISQEIRSICMYEIGQWMQKNSSTYLSDANLKYVGWTLYDKMGDVRLKCLQALQPLYGVESMKDKLELFTKKFKDRFIQLTLDKEPEVAIEALKLDTSILRYSQEILEDKDKEQIYELVYCSHPGVAKAAGDFLNVCLFSDKGDVKSDSDASRIKIREHLRDVVQFFLESELHEHGAYLVDALIESNPMMKDWKCMTDILLRQDPPAGEEPLTSDEEKKLIEIMTCCVRQAATGEPPIGRAPPGRKELSQSERKQIHDDKHALTVHFIETIHKLLTRFMTDDSKVVNLVQIPQYFNLEIYTSGRQEDNLRILLDRMKTIVEKRSDKEVLEACAKTLERLCHDNDAIATQCNTKRAIILEWIGKRFQIVTEEYMDKIDRDVDEPTEDEMHYLVSIMKKVEVFSNAHDMKECNIWDKMFEILSKYLESVNEGKQMKMPVEAVKSCILGCYFGLIWDKHRLENSETRGQTLKAADVKGLKDNFDKYVNAMSQMMQMNIAGPGVVLKEEAFISICDLLIFFSNEKLKNNAALTELFYEPDESLPSKLNQFVQKSVFVPDEENTEEEEDDHKKIEELHKRRNFLSCFCKLIVYSIIPMKSAADVFKQYSTFYNDFGDIIKETLRKCKAWNKVNLAKTIAVSLINKYKEGCYGNGVMERASEQFAQLKELAKKLASKDMPFGADPIKNRQAVTELHREGILFAINPQENPDDPSDPPLYLPFLEVLTEFSGKLLKNPKVDDKEVVCRYLDQRVGYSSSMNYGSVWQPLLIYRQSLTDGRMMHPIDGIRNNKNNQRVDLAESDDDLEIISDKGPVKVKEDYSDADDDELEVVREIPLADNKQNLKTKQVKREKNTPESQQGNREPATAESDDDLEIVLDKGSVNDKRKREESDNEAEDQSLATIKSESENISKRQKETGKDLNDNEESDLNSKLIPSGEDSGIQVDDIKGEERSTTAVGSDECVTLD